MEKLLKKIVDIFLQKTKCMDLYFYSEVLIIYQFSSFQFYNWGDTTASGTRETDESKIGLKQIGSPEEKGRKKLPTIIKYAGQGKDVYLCGRKLMKFNGFLLA